MTTFLLAVITGIVLIQFLRLSERVKRLENQLGGKTFAQPIPQATAVSPVKAPETVPDTKPPVVPSNTLNTNLSHIPASYWLTGVGIVALIFGMGFFLKYAVDQSWVDPVMYVFVGIASGGLLMVLGDLWRKRFASYASMLSGGGAAIMYLSILAWKNFYGLEQMAAFVGLVLVTVLTVILSFRYEKRGLAVLGFLGAYLAPAVLDAEFKNSLFYLGYLSLVHVGGIVAMRKRFWFEIALIALPGMALNLITFDHLTSQPVLPLLFILGNYTASVVGLSYLFNKAHHRGDITKEVSGFFGLFILVSSMVVVLGEYLLLQTVHHELLLGSLLLSGVVTWMGYVLLDRLEYDNLNVFISLAGSLCFMAGISEHFVGSIRVIVLVLTGLLGAGVAFTQKRKEIALWSVLFLYVGSILALYNSQTVYPQSNIAFVVNRFFGVEVLCVLGFALIAGLYRRVDPAQEMRKLSGFAFGSAAALLWYAVSLEIGLRFGNIDIGNARSLMLSLWWVVYAAALAVIGVVYHSRGTKWASALLFAITVIKVFTYDILSLETGYRIVSFIALGIISLGIAFYYQKHKEQVQSFLKK